jgi:hypothetical protein
MRNNDQDARGASERRQGERRTGDRRDAARSDEGRPLHDMGGNMGPAADPGPNAPADPEHASRRTPEPARGPENPEIARIDEQQPELFDRDERDDRSPIAGSEYLHVDENSDTAGRGLEGDPEELKRMKKRGEL